jgi:hypothetical protein
MARKIDFARVEASRRRLRKLSETHPEAFERLGGNDDEISATLVEAGVFEADEPEVVDEGDDSASTSEEHDREDD